MGQFGGRCVGNLNAVARLNIPSICLQDGPAGVRAVDLVSGFPAGINAAATFNRDLIRQRGVAIAEEFRTKGAHVYLGPSMDVMRAPEAGRLWESFGADTYLTGESVYATIIGVQSIGVQACAKHLILNNQETYRFVESSNADQRTLIERYVTPFWRAVDANVTCVMCSYNRVNDTYACQNPALIGETGLLKKTIGFEGFVVSDWGATHGSAADNANSGLDVEMPGGWILIGGGVYSDLEHEVAQGSVSVSTLDTMVIRVLTAYYRLGQDQGYPPTNFNVQSSSNNDHVNARSNAHTSLIKTIADASAVLLKNVDNFLPLAAPSTSGPARKIALIGSDIGAPNKGCLLNACDNGTLSIGWGSGTTTLEYLVTPLNAMNSAVAGTTTTLVTSPSDDQSKAAAAATGADVALVFVNADSGEYNVVPVDLESGSTGDRPNLNLWHSGEALINAVTKVNKNTIVVMHLVGPTVVESWINNANVKGVIMAGLPGEQSGPSIVDVLFGTVNPSGRLPYTIAKSAGDYNVHTVEFEFSLEPDITYTEGLFTDYMYFDAHDITPRFEFGFGLSYGFTTRYSSLQVSGSGSTRTVSAIVQNTGTRAGTEIVQLYLGFPASAQEPPKLLRGFESVPLDVGAQETATFPLGFNELSVWSVTSQSRTVPPGTYTVYVGSSSRDIRLITTFIV
ncbi:glycosyl hydrolase family 3 N terminal domain-containing protein [Cantharellus anzutake]|uniref:glycosyl hydrolase family 3 N terminal domain-containing protein n=1 Tax=Cantharellus anzutake TaxID=1750568 RepID=UPI001902EF4E|nr:glycosyl hydrolase family 3 N terminal domain-containing protein [Cantharellus anzutake]KAF8342918.1 glycosyl hydrolase family 3 N terminal domain-containing protein [Cantharellus anzutake]